MTSNCGRYDCSPIARYYAAAGERNDVMVSRSGPVRDVVELDNDTLRGPADRIRCGSGTDTVDGIGGRDRLAEGCERFTFAAAFVTNVVLRHRLAAPGAWFLRTRSCDCGRLAIAVRVRGDYDRGGFRTVIRKGWVGAAAAPPSRPPR